MHEFTFSGAVLAVAVYASTNIDDLLILAAFFSNARMTAAGIVAGRFLALAALVLVSTLAGWMALAVPVQWISLLGLIPLFLGLRLLAEVWGNRRSIFPEDGSEAARAIATNPVQGIVTQAFSVAGVSLANGGDNLGVYVPLFAASPAAIATYVAVFAVMTLLWCVFGYWVVNNPLIGVQMRRYGYLLLPVVLIALGAYLLRGAAPLLID